MKIRKLVVDYDVSDLLIICLIDKGIEVVIDKEVFKKPYFKPEPNTMYYFTNLTSVLERKPEEKEYILSFPEVIDASRVVDEEFIKNIEESGIFKIPKTYDAYDFTNIPNDVPLILKTALQARSMGKHIFKNKLEYFLFKNIVLGVYNTKCLLPDSNYVYPSELSDKDKEEIMDKFKIDPGAYRDKDEKYLLINAITSKYPMYLQELVNFNYEFRILYFKNMKEDDVIIEIRKGYQPGSKEEREHKVIDINEFSCIVGPNNGNMLIKKVIEFGDYIGKPAISMDLYVNIEEKVKETSITIFKSKELLDYGLFEYSTQFGVEYPLDILERLSKMFNNAIYSYIDDYEKKHMFK